MSLLKDLPELIKANVISADTADRIRDYYGNRSEQSSNRLFIVFGILGALLVGLGIILIIAHNWDELPRSLKTVLAFLPMIVGQLLCGFVLYKKRDSVAWREGCTLFLGLAVGACIAMVSQIYNIPGNISSFILTWMLLCLPLVYIMKSSIASFGYICGITYYAVETGYWSNPTSGYHWYWPLLILILPHYYRLYKNTPRSNFMDFHNWLIPLSLLIVLGTVADGHGALMTIAYLSLLGLFYAIGNLSFFNNQPIRSNGFLVLGSIGTVGILLGLSFGWFWEDLRRDGFEISEALPEVFTLTLLTILATIFFLMSQRGKSVRDIKPLSIVFLLFIIIFWIGLYSPISVVLINILVLAIGVQTIRIGAERNHLVILNYGLLIITALIICRFFDANLGFVFRGILFVLVGVGFIAANYWMLKKRKANG